MMPVLPAPTLELIAELSVTVSQAIDAGEVRGPLTRGRRRIIPITGGTVRGKLQGKVLPGGADFQVVVSDTTAILDARYMLELDNGARVFVQNNAVRRASAEDVAKLIRGEPVDPNRVYFRCVPTFEVSDPELYWLTESVFVGTGARSPDAVEIAFYRVC
jgi:Protein of unknown function (DUF3237)